jgi:hypothetical protein
MRRRYRVLLAAGALMASAGLVAGLVLLGSAAEGPIATALQSVGASVSRIEARVAYRLRGPGRASEMPWLAPLRADADSLKAPGRLLLGAFDDGLPHSLDGVLEVETTLGTTLPLIHFYTAWGDRPDQRFPLRLVQAIRELGSIPVITWEPWLVDFENRLHPHLPLRPDRDRGGLAHIANGAYDFYIDAWAGHAARYGHPIMVRFAHEMNDPYRYPWGPQNNRPEDFIAAWRHVVDRFRRAGADNVVWVWSPHVAYEGYQDFYPGDDATDWVATGVLNYGTVAHWSRWWTFDEIFGRHYDDLAAFAKPIMIAELGTLAVGGDRAEWFDQALDDLPTRYPSLRGLVFFHASADATVTYQALDWSIVDDPASIAAIRRTMETW